MNDFMLFNRRHLALGLVSAALLAFQIVLLQLLATSQWHHFAYFIISVALLGFGVAGTILSLAREWLLARQLELLPWLLFGCAVTLAAPLSLTQKLFGGFDSFLLFVDSTEILRLVVVALLLMSPFLLGALAIGIVFSAETQRIGSYYFANLLGSGLGSLLGLLGLMWVLPQQLPLACSMIAFVAAALLQPNRRRRYATLVSGLMVLLISAQLLPAEPVLSPYKDLRRTLDLPGAKIVARRPAAAGQVHIVTSPALRSASGVSLNWTRPVPAQPAVFINGNSFGALPPAPGSDNPRNASTFALPYALSTPQSVLVLDAATGADVVQALDRGADAVTAVEPHGVVTATMAEIFVDRFGLLLKDTRVNWQTHDGRSWLAREGENYDLIVFPPVGLFGGNAGLAALHEQPLLTREAMRNAFRRLQPQGMLALTVWVDYPVRKPLRLLATLVEALEEEGVAVPLNHIAAVRSWGMLTLCVKHQPLTATDLAKVREFAAQWAFDPALLPDLRPEERQYYNRLEDDSLLSLLDAVLGAERKDLYENYSFRIRPVSDERPFFSQFLRWDRMAGLLDLYGRQTMPFLEIGLLTAGLAALVLTTLAALLILLPLIKLPRAGGQLGKTLLYFGGLGIGYMWVELALLHRFVIYLGQPIYSAALVIGVLLVGSGIGSGLSGRFSARYPARWAGAVAMTIVLYSLLLGPFLQSTLQLGLAGRVALTILVLAPVAVIMGAPFPVGLRWLDLKRPAEVPWAWGINSCLSVVAAAMATLIAVEVGFSILLGLAASSYLVSALILWMAREKLSSTP